jgi:hypothetical protein
MEMKEEMLEMKEEMLEMKEEMLEMKEMKAIQVVEMKKEMEKKAAKLTNKVAIRNHHFFLF